MGKKKASRTSVNGDQRALIPDAFPEVPKEVQTAVEDYSKARLAKSIANARFKAAENRAIELMKEHDVPKCRYEYKGVDKWLKCEDEPKLSTEAITEGPEPAGVDE